MIEIVLTEGPGRMLFHGVVSHGVAAFMLYDLKPKQEIILKTSKKPKASYHG